jgi:lipoyl(octanoyl) transferase
VIIRKLGLVEYEPTWHAMQRFTDQRDAATEDELWLLQHPPVFTLGMAADPAHLLMPGEIPVVQTDRGGQVTYHGPGQLIVYPLVDIRRLGISVRGLVQLCEQVVIDLVAPFAVQAEGRRDAPGVYVAGRKLGSVGMRIRRGASYHGLALNVDMDLGPFQRINPCGLVGMEVTQLSALGISLDINAAGDLIAENFRARLAA